jgi:hypothetical protein
MTKLNLILWAVSLTLQCVLLAVLFSRGIARQIPVLGILIGFYVVRSTASYTIFRHLQPATFEFLFSALAIVDVVLQIVTAWVLYSAAERSVDEQRSLGAGLGPREPLRGLSMLTRLAVFCVFLIVAAGFAISVAMFIRVTPRAPVDRSIVFVSGVYLLVFFATVAKKISPLIRRLVGGFAFYAAASIVCQTGRAVAGAQRNAILFNRWSYAAPAAYLAVVVFWIVVLPRVTRVVNSCVAGRSRVPSTEGV